ncbi:MAG: endonuclease [Acidobacteria bacterium]|nr:endonuclease [Acidobacteriota bacterium]
MKTGVCYLIHFDQAYKQARHYMGFTDDLEARLERHRAGNGARLMEVITAAGITWRVARTWQGDRKLERRLKRRKSAPTFCPICSPATADKRANFRKAVK